MGTARLSAGLFVESEELSVEDMDRMIGIECNESWRKGDRRLFVDDVYATNSWQLEFSAETPDTPCENIVEKMNGLIEEIVRRMHGHEEDFRLVAERAVSGLTVAMSCSYVPPIEVRADVLKGICALGVELAFDVTLSG